MVNGFRRGVKRRQEWLMDLKEAKNIVIDKVKSLPTLPEVIHKILSLVQGEDATAKALGDLIAYDQAISARLLKVANSAYYGFMREIATVQHAIVVLGFREVKSLVLGITVFDAMKRSSQEASIKREAFWMHSIGCALAGQLICKKVEKVDADIAFTASILHDLGKLVLDGFFSSDYKGVLERVQTNGVSMVDAEIELMGFTHADVGGWLCERWKFPPILVSPVCFHHQLEKADVSSMHVTSVAHLADVLCKRSHIGSGGDDKIQTVHPLAMKNLKLNEDDLNTITEELQEDEEKVKAFLGAIQ